MLNIFADFSIYKSNLTKRTFLLNDVKAYYTTLTTFSIISKSPETIQYLYKGVKVNCLPFHLCLQKHFNNFKSHPLITTYNVNSVVRYLTSLISC